MIKKKKNYSEDENKENDGLFLNKKTKRHKSEEKNKDQTINKRNKNKIKNRNKSNNVKKIRNKSLSHKKDSEECTTTEKIYNNFSFHQSHLSKMTFNDKIITNNNSAPFSYNSLFFESNTIENNDENLSLKEPEEKLLYISKEEEEAFKVISQEIKPLEDKLSEFNSFITEKKKKLKLISKLISEMNENLDKYKTTRFELTCIINDIKACFKITGDTFKILKKSEKIGDIPFKEEVYNTHIKLMKNILKKCENFVENNDMLINKLNNYDIAFSSSKAIIEENLKDIIDGLCEKKNGNEFYKSLKNVLNPSFSEALTKLSIDDNTCDSSIKRDNSNDMKNIYEKNIQIKYDFDSLVEKVKNLEK